MNITNKQARHIALHCSGLVSEKSMSLTPARLLKLVKFLGYVQLDPIQVVSRAHDHILWSRNTSYQPELLSYLLENERSIFEHFCHDACVLPTDTLPYWQEQFKRKAAAIKKRSNKDNVLSQSEHKKLLARIAEEGPLCSSDFKVKSDLNKKGVWSKPAHKQTLDHLWLSGELAVSKRVKFKKYYDLSERIYPQSLVDKAIDKNERMAWLVRHAFNRLGFASHTEIQRFWDATTLTETKQWFEINANKIRALKVEKYDGTYLEAQSLASNAALLKSPPLPSKRVRILNPFDPLTRDRKRLKALFGFDYTIEMYVPANKRQYGYYVYPMLEFDTFIGRIEVRHDRQRNILCVDNLWHENKIKFGQQRMQKIRSELERLRRFCGAELVEWSQ